MRNLVPGERKHKFICSFDFSPFVFIFWRRPSVLGQAKRKHSWTSQAQAFRGAVQLALSLLRTLTVPRAKLRGGDARVAAEEAAHKGEVGEVVFVAYLLQRLFCFLSA